jgi:hypothetical protein
MTDLFTFPARLPDRTVLILDRDPIVPTLADAWAAVLQHTGGGPG